MYNQPYPQQPMWGQPQGGPPAYGVDPHHHHSNHQVLDLNDPRPAREIFHLPEGALRETELNPKTRGVDTRDLPNVVRVLSEMASQGREGEAQVAEALMGEPELACALLQALHEAGCLVDTKTGALAPQPQVAQPPQLPPHIKSWLGPRR